MTGLTPEPTTPNQSPSLQDQILNHVSSLEILIKEHNEKSGTLITPIRLTFGEEVDTNRGNDNENGGVGVDDYLKRPYKEVQESPFTRRIIEFSAPSHRMPTNLEYMTAPRTRTTTSPASWRLSIKGNEKCRRCSKDPTEVSKIVRKANESLPDFKERWTEEILYIQGVPEVMQMSSFISNSKCPELARRFADQVPQTVTEMMKRVDDFVKSEKSFKSTELPKGEQSEKGHGVPYKGFRPPRMGRRYENRRFKHRGQEVNQLSLEFLVKRPKEILATELQLQLPPPSPLVGTPKKENMDRYCDYHGEKGHYTNDCFQLRRQLEIALESEKLNHLVKDVRQRGGNYGRQGGNGSTHGKIINMARLSQTHTELVGFSGEQLRPMGKIELEVVFGNEGLSRRTMMKFTVVEASSPYNIILGRTGMRELHDVSSTTHVMMKFPTPRGIATLVLRRDAIFECSDVFAWQPPYMVGIPRRISLHALNVNPSVTLVAQKRRTLGQEKSKVVTKEVDELLRARITKKDMIMDVMEKFDNLKKINMKLNPKKCSFGVKEGKFLGYMVTSEGIRANPRRQRQWLICNPQRR
uniref:Reverse transcriptase domain-containing protein n=1 Tax=Tanacetum cinerariifolium TaxID=118510 RepID=A0A6L2M8K5_TANCI|nr:reverse transcriptase domain-containing protein [Tanacetum cinerariifolium]